MSTETEPLIDPNRVEEILKDCLFTDEELPETPTEENLPDGAIIVDSVVNRFALHGGRLVSHREEISRMLGSLPREFAKTPGGGWSMLNGCIDRNEVLWTGFQKRVGELVALGVGLNLAGYVLKDRALWASFPGGLPYFWVADECFPEEVPE